MSKTIETSETAKQRANRLRREKRAAAQQKKRDGITQLAKDHGKGQDKRRKKQLPKLVTMSLPCKLTAKERDDYGLKLAGEELRLYALEEQKRETVKTLAAEITQQRTSIRSLSAVISKRHELRDVKVEIRRDFQEKSVTLVRIDTGEQVETRAMSESEMQMSFDDVK